LSEENIVTDEVPENIVVEYINFEARATWRFAGGSDLILAWDSGYTAFPKKVLSIGLHFKDLEIRSTITSFQ
jgi:hypothetical protein